MCVVCVIINRAISWTDIFHACYKSETRLIEEWIYVVDSVVFKDLINSS